ncbi:hypothetical protein ABT127_30130 [Streptomyces sp. NPDC001904]
MRRRSTDPVADTGDRIIVLYRVRDPEDVLEPGEVEIIFLLSAP